MLGMLPVRIVLCQNRSDATCFMHLPSCRPWSYCERSAASHPFHGNLMNHPHSRHVVGLNSCEAKAQNGKHRNVEHDSSWHIDIHRHSISGPRKIKGHVSAAKCFGWLFKSILANQLPAVIQNEKKLKNACPRSAAFWPWASCDWISSLTMRGTTI